MTDAELTALDRLLAERVMGWHQKKHGDDGSWLDGIKHTGFSSSSALAVCQECGEDWIWRPTTNIAQAFMVAEKIGNLILVEVYEQRGHWYAAFRDKAEADTPSLAICLATQNWLAAHPHQQTP